MAQKLKEIEESKKAVGEFEVVNVKLNNGFADKQDALTVQNAAKGNDLKLNGGFNNILVRFLTQPAEQEHLKKLFSNPGLQNTNPAPMISIAQSPLAFMATLPTSDVSVVPPTKKPKP